MIVESAKDKDTNAIILKVKVIIIIYYNKLTNDSIMANCGSNTANCGRNMANYDRSLTSYDSYLTYYVSLLVLIIIFLCICVLIIKYTCFI